MTPELTDIYDALKDSVRFYPKQEIPCCQPQTWRVLQKSLGVEISTENLGATICDKDKPYFWSRRWHESKYKPDNIQFDYPLLYAFEMPGTLKDPFGSNPQFIYTLQIGVLDVLSDDGAARSCMGCNGRTINEINETTQGILQACIDYLKNTYPYSINDAAPVWANKTFIDYGLSANRFTANRTGGSITDKAQSLNPDATFFRVEKTGNIYGTAITLRFYGGGCVTPEWNFNETDFGVLAHEAGCSNC